MLKERAGIRHAKTIAKAIRELESRGWLERRKRFGASTVYTLIYQQREDKSPDDSPVSHDVTCIKSPDDSPVSHDVTCIKSPDDSPVSHDVTNNKSPDDSSVSHDVTCIKSPDDSYLVTPSHTNKILLTRTNEQDPLGARESPRAGERPSLSPVDHAFERAIKEKSPVEVIRSWRGAPHLIDLCIAFQSFFGVPVVKADAGRWLRGAQNLYELRPTQDELLAAASLAEARDLFIVHPGAAYNLVKMLRQQAAQKAAGANGTGRIASGPVRVLREKSYVTSS
jgi:hypothetical protein